MGNNIQIFGRTFSDVSSITVNNTSSSAVKYVQEPIFEDITISQDYLVEQNTVVSNGIIFQTDETYPGTPVVLNNTNAIGIDNGSLGQRGAGIKIDLNKTYHCAGELRIEWSTGEQEIYSIDSDFTPANYNTDNSLSFSWEGVGTSIQTFYRINFRLSGSNPQGYNYYINAYTATSLIKSGVLLDGSYYQISVISDGFNTINLNLSDDPRFQAVYKSLAYRSVIASSSPGVSEWCNSLSRIEQFMFAGQALSGDFTFNNISSVGQYAFAVPWAGTGTNLTTSYTVNFLRSSGISFGYYPFYNNRMIRGINAPYLSIINEGFCYNCSSLTTASFPECTSIGNFAFYSCVNLTIASFPECTSIGQSAFYSCRSLTTIFFPKCTSIGYGAFASCRSLTTASFPECTSIVSNVFYNCNNLTTISFPKCTSIGYVAFASCSNLTNISFPECTFIESNAFNYCSNLTTISFPKCINMGTYVFYNCINLTIASFPECTSIGNQTFNGCINLTTASFPECTSIGNSAFYNCSSLTTISFPKCTFIGNSAFTNCSSLTTISFPECISIGVNAFYNCRKLESAYFMGSSIPSIGANIFYQTPMGSTTYLGYYGSIYVPSSLLASYKTATNWTTYSSRMVGI